MAALAVAVVLSLGVAAEAADIVLFSDNFNSPDNTDINADVATAGRQGGTLGNLTYVVEQGTGDQDARIVSNQLAMNPYFDGTCCPGTVELVLDHDFAPTIGTGGSFTVKYGMNPKPWGIFGLGLPSNGASAVGEEFGLRLEDGEDYQVTLSGVSDTVGPIPGADTGKTYGVEISVTTADFNSGTVGSVSVLFDGTPLDLSSAAGDQFTANFTWDADNTMFLGFTMDQGLPADAVLIDDLEVSTVPEPATMGLLALGGLSVLARRRRRQA